MRNRAEDNKIKTTIPHSSSSLVARPHWPSLLTSDSRIPFPTAVFIQLLQEASLMQGDFTNCLSTGKKSGASDVTGYSKILRLACFESSLCVLQSSAPRLLPNLPNICSIMEQTTLQRNKLSVVGTLGSCSFQAGFWWMGVQVLTSTTSESCG